MFVLLTGSARTTETLHFNLTQLAVSSRLSGLVLMPSVFASACWLTPDVLVRDTTAVVMRSFVGVTGAA